MKNSTGSTGTQLTLTALWARGAQGAVLRGAHTGHRIGDVASVILMIGIVTMMLIFWWESYGGRQTGDGWNMGARNEGRVRDGHGGVTGFARTYGEGGRERGYGRTTGDTRNTYPQLFLIKRAEPASNGGARAS